MSPALDNGGSGQDASAPDPKARPTLEQIGKYVFAMSRVIPFFPQDDLALALITQSVRKFAGTNERLEWFAAAACDQLSKYEGIPMLRALYATRYKPADGGPVLCEVPGLEEESLEAQHAERVMKQNQDRYRGYVKDRTLAPPEDFAPFDMDAVLSETPAMPAPSKDELSQSKAWLEAHNLPVIAADEPRQVDETAEYCAALEPEQ